MRDYFELSLEDALIDVEAFDAASFTLRIEPRDREALVLRMGRGDGEALIHLLEKALKVP